jgi:hypothetical protein
MPLNISAKIYFYYYLLLLIYQNITNKKTQQNCWA